MASGHVMMSRPGLFNKMIEKRFCMQVHTTTPGLQVLQSYGYATPLYTLSSSVNNQYIPFSGILQFRSRTLTFCSTL